MVEAEQAAKTFALDDLAVPILHAFGHDQAVPEALMVPLEVVVLHVLGDRPSKICFIERYDPVEALAPDGQPWQCQNPRFSPALQPVETAGNHSISWGSGQIHFSHRTRWRAIRSCRE